MSGRIAKLAGGIGIGLGIALSSAQADAQDATAEVAPEGQCKGYVLGIGFKRDLPSAGGIKRFVEYVQADLQGRDPSALLERRLSKQERYLDDPRGYTDDLESVIKAVAELGGADSGKRVPVHVEIWGFSGKHGNHRGQKVYELTSGARVQFLTIGTQLAAKLHNEKVHKTRRVFIPHIPGYSSGGTDAFGTDPTDNDIGLFIIRLASETEAGYQRDQFAKLRAGEQIDPADYDYDRADFTEPSLSAAISSLRPGVITCYDREKTRAPARIIPAPELLEVKRQAPVLPTEETRVKHADIPFRRDNPYGAPDVKLVSVSKTPESPLSHIESKVERGVDRARDDQSETLTKVTPDASEDTAGRPDKSAPLRDRPIADTAVIKSFDDRIYEISQRDLRLRRDAYGVFALRVLRYFGEVGPECSNHADDDRDGTADFKGIRYKGQPRIISRDKGCSSADDETEGDHPCEGIIDSLAFLAKRASDLTQIDRNPVSEERSKAITDVCSVYAFLLDAQHANQCVDQYAVLVADTRTLMQDTRDLWDEATDYCEAHNCVHHIPAWFMGKHLIQTRDDVLKTYKAVRVRETHSITQGKLPDLQTLCSGIQAGIAGGKGRYARADINEISLLAPYRPD